MTKEQPLPPQLSPAVREFNRAHIEEMLPVLHTGTIQILEAIPELPNPGAANTRELDAFDKPRRDRLEFLIGLAESYAALGGDPSDIVESMLPHTDRVFGGLDPIRYHVRLARIMYSSERDAGQLWEHATQTADEIGDVSTTARAFSLIGSSKAHAGLHEDADADFARAIDLIRIEQEEVKGNPMGEIGALSTIEDVMMDLHEHERWELFHETLSTVGDEELRGHIKETFLDKTMIDLQTALTRAGGSDDEAITSAFRQLGEAVFQNAHISWLGLCTDSDELDQVRHSLYLSGRAVQIPDYDSDPELEFEKAGVDLFTATESLTTAFRPYGNLDTYFIDEERLEEAGQTREDSVADLELIFQAELPT